MRVMASCTIMPFSLINISLVRVREMTGVMMMQKSRFSKMPLSAPPWENRKPPAIKNTNTLLTTSV